MRKPKKGKRKLKTNRAAAKRFKVTAVDPADAPNIRRMLLA